MTVDGDDPDPREIVRLLGQAPILVLLPPDALFAIAAIADTRRLRPGEMLFRQGDRSDGGYVVLSGSLAIGREGDERAVATLGPGSLVGQVALFVRLQRPATAIAREMSNVIRISPTLTKRVLRDHPAAARGMRRLLARDLEALNVGLDRVSRMLARITPADEEATAPASP